MKEIILYTTKELLSKEFDEIETNIKVFQELVDYVINLDDYDLACEFKGLINFYLKFHLSDMPESIDLEYDKIKKYIDNYKINKEKDRKLNTLETLIKYLFGKGNFSDLEKVVIDFYNELTFFDLTDSELTDILHLIESYDDPGMTDLFSIVFQDCSERNLIK